MQNYHLFSDGAQWTLTREGSDTPVGVFTSKLEGVMSCCQFLRSRQGSLQLHAGDGRLSSRSTSRSSSRTVVSGSPATMQQHPPVGAVS